MKKPPSFFVTGPVAVGGLLSLPEEERRHARARRLRTGSAVRLIDGSGGAAAGTVERFDRSSLEIRVTELQPAPEPASPISVLAPVIRAARLAWLVEKATELGAAKIVLVDSSRAQAGRAGDARHSGARLARLAREAAKQCGRSDCPAVDGPIAFRDAAGLPADRRLLLDPAGAPFPDVLPGSSFLLWVGPEGGFTPAEVALAEEEGWERTRLPGATLRGETAVLAALALAARAIDRAPGRADNTPTP